LKPSHRITDNHGTTGRQYPMQSSRIVILVASPFIYMEAASLWSSVISKVIIGR
jgi:hypothetical protein